MEEILINTGTINSMEQHFAGKNMTDFAKLLTDKIAIKIFLDIAKNDFRFFDNICEDTSLEPEDVATYLKKLEEVNLIEKNPGPVSKKYVLAFNGQIFAQKLQEEYPQVREFLGGKNFIRPLKLK